MHQHMVYIKTNISTDRISDIIKHKFQLAEVLNSMKVLLESYMMVVMTMMRTHEKQMF